MKNAQRQVYLVLATEIGWCLCGFCSYSGFNGCDCARECRHTLMKMSEEAPGQEPGYDCWGYRPRLPLSDIADIVGLILSQGFDPEKTIYYPSKEKIEVVGIKFLGTDKTMKGDKG